MTRHRLIPVTEVAREAIAPRHIKLTLHKTEFSPLSGPDEFFGLLMPELGKPSAPFEVGTSNIRAAVAGLDANIRLALRWYTFFELDVSKWRRHDDENGPALCSQNVEHISGPGGICSLLVFGPRTPLSSAHEFLDVTIPSKRAHRVPRPNVTTARFSGCAE